MTVGRLTLPALPVAALVIACSSAAPASTSPAPASTSSAPREFVSTPLPTTVFVTPTPSPTPNSTPPVVEPTASSTPPPSATGHGFTIEWKEHAPDFGPETAVTASAVIDDRIVVVGSTYGDDGVDRPTIWWENGDLRWRQASTPAVNKSAQLSAIAPIASGLAAFGNDNGPDASGLLWTSLDGKTWQAADGSLFDEVLWNPGQVPVGVAVGGVIVLGRHGEPFVSSNGRDWRISTDPNTVQMADLSYGFAGSGTELTAFSQRVVPCGGDVTGDPCTEGPVLVWRSAGPESWAKVGELPGSENKRVVGAAVGPRGWVAVGEGMAWTSADGSSWTLADGAPQWPYVDSMRIFGTAAGFVAVGDYFVDQCAIDGGYTNTVTWTSPDGRIWRVADTIEYADVLSLRRRGDTLIGLGNVHQLGGAYAQTWTAALPADSSNGDPVPSPAPLPTSEVCP